jgi:hypothetical protein
LRRRGESIATPKFGFIFEQTPDRATRERWFHECLGENPALLDEVGYVRLRAGEEPTLCFSAEAAKGFLTWQLQKGYGDPEQIQSKLDFFEEAH